jgi:hypothetical protein
MAFAVDRDLLVLEPGLFREVLWTGQRLVSGSGNASGTALTMSSQDVLFDAADVGDGNVVLVGGTAYEVIDRVSGTVLTISRLRGSPEGAAIPVTGATGAEVIVATFGPQLATVHRQVLRMLGIEPDVTPPEGEPTEASIVNPGALARLEALGALHLVYSAAGSSLGIDSPPAQKSMLYRERFAAERQRVVALLDLDGDGRPDATRRLNVIQFLRG